MKLVDTEETVVLVVGSSPTAAERDRPLAFALKAEIDGRGAGHAYRRAVVVTDAQYLENAGLQESPTIAIGGPGSNAACEELTSQLPTIYARDEQVFVQADLAGEPKRAALWGVDAACTAAAVNAFATEGFLDELLERIWKFRVGTVV